MTDLRKQFKREHPETIGETDQAFDNANYIDWLEKKLVNQSNREPLNEKPLVVERYADNGAHSHWDLIDVVTGETLWSEAKD